MPPPKNEENPTQKKKGTAPDPCGSSSTNPFRPRADLAIYIYIYMHDFRVGRVFGLEVWFGRCGVDRGKLGLHERLFTAAQLL